jgi:RimJ/RimL family protein N-acetyltransferase
MPSFQNVRLETPRLVLRPFRHADAPDLFAIYSDPEVYRYVPIGGWKEMDEAHQRIARDIHTMTAGEILRLAVQRRDDSRVVGEVLLFNFAEASGRAEIGYALAREAWGCGYAREALPPLIDYAFDALGLRRLHANVDPRNVASAKVLERLGFVLEGTQREHYVDRGDEVSDGALYGLLAREWRAERA